MSVTPDAWILTVAGLIALGLPIAEISRRVHRSRPTVRQIRDTRQDLVMNAVRQLTNPSDTFAPMLPAAASSYHRALQSGDARVAQDVFDRLYGKPLQREQRTERRDVVVTFVDASD